MNYHKSVDHELNDNLENDKLIQPSSKKRKIESSLICNICDKIFATRSNLLRHIRLHDSIDNQFTCEKFRCMETFNDEINLELHVKNDHDDDNYFECDYCSATWYSKIMMEKHFVDDHSISVKRPRRKIPKIISSSQKCDECDEIFNDEKDLEFHVMTVHEILCRKLKPDEVKINLRCCKCEENLETTEELTEHLNIHEDDFRKFKCKLCKQQLKTFDEFFEHSEYHILPPTHKCLSQKCKRDFKYDEIFLNHLRYHKSQDRYMKRVKCEKCGKKLKSQKELINHDKIKHKKETLFICPMCAKSMGSNNALDQHIK